MFTSDPNITDLDIRQKKVAKVLFSMNIHQVATPELTAEDARCYIIFVGESSSLSAHIGLYLPRSDRRFYYSSSNNPFSAASLAEVEEEGRAFVEDMGFLLDEIPLATMSADERNRWIDEHDMFTRKKAEAPQPKAAPAETKSAAAPKQEPAAGQQWQPPAPVAAPQRQQQALPARNEQSQAVVSREKEALARLLASF
jgi:hypothetical protein